MLRAMKAKVDICVMIAAITFTITAASLVSQTPTATGETSLQSGVEPVSLDLIVRNRHNRPVLDLKPEQVTVADNGKPAKLTDLRLVNGDQQNEPLIALLFDRPGMEVSERISEDSLFGPSASSARATSRKLRQVASRFLRTFPAGEFRFAVMDVWGRLQIQQEYSANRKTIAEAVFNAVQPEVYGTKVEPNVVERRLLQVAKTGQDSAGAAASVQERTLDRAMYTALRTSTRIAKDQHLSPSLACLLALVEAQQSLPGRKAIVYFNSIEEGSGDPYHSSGKDSHAEDALQSIIGAANRAGVNIYVVLPYQVQDNHLFSGMSSADQVGGANQLGFGSTPTKGSVATMDLDWGMAVAATSASPSKSDIFVQENMSQLAKQTGGDVLNGSGRMRGQVKDLVQSLTTFYEVSFVPLSGVEDGTFHRTAFKSSRTGLRMGGPMGYLAMPPSAGITEPLQPFEVPLMALLKRQQLAGDVDYRARVMHMEQAEEGNVGLVALEVPVSGLLIRTDTSTRLSSAHVSILATITDRAGSQIERFSEDIARRWSADSGSGTAPGLICFERSFAAPAGNYVLETAILDNNSGKVAAKRQTFEVSASRSMPGLSDLMVVREIEPADNGTGGPDLLWRGARRVLPNLYGELPAGAHTVSVFFLAHADPKSPAPATVKLEVLRDGAPLKGAPLTSTLKAGDEFSPVLTAFSISSAANGKYEVRATLIQDEKSAEKTGEFVLTGEGKHIAPGGTASTDDAVTAVDQPGLTAAQQPADRPTQEELDRILADARKNALAYADALPNLICQQTTQRYDAKWNGDWWHKDTIVEVLSYVNHKESRILVGDLTAGEMSGTRISSTGEFGEALTNIFKPESKAKFTWREADTLRGEPAEVFDYRVEQENSPFVLNALPEAVANVAYHGRIYIDQATHGVMRITIITDEQPKKFPIRKAAIRVDYDYVAINDHDYLLPVSAQVVTKVSGNIGDVLRRNDLTFSNFHRFGSTARILGVEAEEDPQ
jgi:VWFA-related protein